MNLTNDEGGGMGLSQMGVPQVSWNNSRYYLVAGVMTVSLVYGLS